MWCTHCVGITPQNVGKEAYPTLCVDFPHRAWGISRFPHWVWPNPTERGFIDTLHTVCALSPQSVGWERMLHTEGAASPYRTWGSADISYNACRLPPRNVAQSAIPTLCVVLQHGMCGSSFFTRFVGITPQSVVYKPAAPRLVRILPRNVGFPTLCGACLYGTWGISADTYDT